MLIISGILPANRAWKKKKFRKLNILPEVSFLDIQSLPITIRYGKNDFVV